MLHRSATSLAAILAARRLWQPGVATLDTGGDVWPTTSLARAGVPVIEEVPCPTVERNSIRRAVDAIGGFPVVVRVGAGEGGVGLILAESWVGLVSLIDHLLASGHLPLLARLVPEAVHWRCVVVGRRCVASYPGAPVSDDFRTIAPHPEAAIAAPPDVVELACAAAAALGHEFAGVDLLSDTAGGTRVLEVNSPCAFGVAQEVTGIDVAGAIVERLVELAASPSPPALAGARSIRSQGPASVD